MNARIVPVDHPFADDFASRWLERHPGKPWDEEPDAAKVVHGDTPIVLLRNPFYVWCGYIGLTADHPLYQADYYDAWELFDNYGFGDVTYSGFHTGCAEITGMDLLWWVGFDCGHAGQYAPCLPIGIGHEVYWTIDHAAEHACAIADGLAAGVR